MHVAVNIVDEVLFTPDTVTVEDLGVKNSLAIKLMKDAGWN